MLTAAASNLKMMCKLLAHIIQHLLIQCFLYYSPLREKSVHILLELLIVISLQQVHQFMGHDISETLR